jgi:hypothetical protein
MLRVTHNEVSGGVVLLRLEGRLGGSDLPLVARALAAREPREIALDLSELRGLDEAARAWLSQLIASGAQVAAATPFLARLLAPAAE